MIASADFAVNALLREDVVYDRGRDLLLNSVGWLTRRDALLGLRPRPREHVKLVLQDDQLERMSLIAVGIMPYITASIVVQLAASLHPALMAIKKEGESGRRKLNQYSRYGAVALALLAFNTYPMVIALIASLELITNMLVSKNNRVRLEAARRTIEELEARPSDINPS